MQMSNIYLEMFVIYLDSFSKTTDTTYTTTWLCLVGYSQLLLVL